MREETYKRIVIATDGSKPSRKAIEKGVDLAKITGAKLYAVYVIVPMVHSARDFGWEKAAMEHFRDEGMRATAFVEEVAKAAGLEIESVLLEGHPADEIVKFAVQNDIDMIVMGTLGKTGVDRFLLGSVAENVIRHSRIPVLVVRDENTNEEK
jgi:nucleotide-binding universal stress UspA family protein